LQKQIRISSYPPQFNQLRLLIVFFTDTILKIAGIAKDHHLSKMIAKEGGDDNANDGLD